LILFLSRKRIKWLFYFLDRRGVRKMASCVLLYELEGELLKKTREVLAVQRLRGRRVERTQYGLPLERLAAGKMEAEPPYEGEGLAGPMLVFCGLTGAQLDRLLSSLRRAGVRIPLKAVLTPTNAGWDSVKLHSELERERRAVLEGNG